MNIGTLSRLGIVFGAFLVAVTVVLGEPSWWRPRGVTNPDLDKDDYAVANVGQLKWMATQANQEMASHLITGGCTLPTFQNANNHQPANLGQAKNLAKLFYDHMDGMLREFSKNQLIANGYPATFWDNEPTGPYYPWTAATSDDANYSPLTIGQLKILFCFDVSADSDGDHIGDLNEGHLSKDPNDPDENNNNILDGYDDDDGDGYMNITEIHAGSDPLNSTSKPTLTATLQVYTPIEQ